MPVSALVVTYNNVSEIEASLDALLAQRVHGEPPEVIVVDNASQDGTVEVLQGYGDRILTVLRDSNSGYAAGNNEALALSSGDVIALVNPDCVVDPGCLETLTERLRDRPGVAMTAALLRNADGTPQLFARRDVGLRGTFWAFTEMGQRLDKRLGGRHADHRRYATSWPPQVPMAVDCPAAACVAVWRQLVSDRLFDPAFPLLFNDADLHRRLRARSYSLEVVPGATATHGYGTSIRRVVTARMRAERLASLRRYVARDWGLLRCAALWVLLVLDAVFLLPLTLVGHKRGRNRALLRGTLGGLGLPCGHLPWLLKVPSPAARLRAVLRRLRNRPRAALVRWSRLRRRRSLLRRLRYQAWKHRVDLHATIDHSADIERPLIELRPGTRVTLEIGPRSTLREGVILRLGGHLTIGAGVDIRWGTTLNVKGHLVISDRVALGRGVSVHVDGEQELGFGVIVGEYATVLDTDHANDGSPVAIFDQPVKLRPVSIGAGAFLGAKCTVLPGVTIGRNATIGAGAVVTRSVPDGGIALGPAATVREPTARER